MYVAEEQPKVASYINSWPKNEPIQRFFKLNRPFFKELMDRMKMESQFHFHSQGVGKPLKRPSSAFFSFRKNLLPPGWDA